MIAVASAGDYGFALVDGNGDGSELEAEHWLWQQGAWQSGGSSGVGPLDAVGLLHSGGHTDDTAWFAYGSAPGQEHCHRRLLRPEPSGTRRQLRRLGVHRYPGRSRRA